MRLLLLLLGAIEAFHVAGSAAELPFEPSIPVVFLDSKEAIASDRKVSCSVKMIQPKGQEQGNTGVLPGVVKFHGASSQAYPKKSFAITLDTPVSWLGLRPSAHWVLNAAFVDRSLMRHKLSYDLFRSLSTTNAPRFASASRFVEVALNGKYHGAYLLMERVDRAMLGFQRYNSNALHHACIYKAVDHVAHFDRLGHGGYEQREPDPLTLPYFGPLDRFNRFCSTTKDDDFFDPKKGIGARLDLDNTIDFHLLVLLTSNMDGNDKNLIIAREAPGTNGPVPRFFFVPWDYDATFGRNWEASRVPSTVWLSNHLFDRLLGNAEYRSKFAARWKQLRAGPFSMENLHRMIDDNARSVREAAKRNALHWRTLEGPYPDRLSFDEDLLQMKEWITARLKWLDQEIGQRAGARAP